LIHWLCCYQYCQPHFTLPQQLLSSAEPCAVNLTNLIYFCNRNLKRCSWDSYYISYIKTTACLSQCSFHALWVSFFHSLQFCVLLCFQSFPLSLVLLCIKWPSFGAACSRSLNALQLSPTFLFFSLQKIVLNSHYKFSYPH
jgi:hypothetical protein